MDARRSRSPRTIAPRHRGSTRREDSAARAYSVAQKPRDERAARPGALQRWHAEQYLDFDLPIRLCRSNRHAALTANHLQQRLSDRAESGTWSSLRRMIHSAHHPRSTGAAHRQELREWLG